MTSYTNHPDSIFDLGAPILGSTHLEARDNLIALAEGAEGAPKIKGLALEGFYLAHLERKNSATPIGVNDLDGFSQLTLLGSIESRAGSYRAQVRFSTDNGSSFGGWFDLGTESEQFVGVIVIDKAGNKATLSGFEIKSGEALTGGSATKSMTIPPDANAFQLRNSYQA